MGVIEMVRMLGNGEFDEVDNGKIQFWADFVSPMVSRKRFGKMYDQAKALLICHKLSLNGHGKTSIGELGSIKNGYVASSVSDGGTSISFANVGAGNTAANAEYAATVYGAQYLQLARMCIVPICISGESDYCEWS